MEKTVMSSSVLDRVRGIAADVLEVPLAQVEPNSSAETIEAWDSIHHLNLVLALEHEFQMQFEPEEIDQMRNIELFVAVISGKLNLQDTR
jgi:acyl carrier protein